MLHATCLTFSAANLHLSITMSNGSPCNSGTIQETNNRLIIRTDRGREWLVGQIINAVSTELVTGHHFS